MPGSGRVLRRRRLVRRNGVRGPSEQSHGRLTRAGVITCLDTVWNDSVDPLDLLSPCLPHVEYFLPSMDEAALLIGLQSPADSATFLLRKGVGVVGLNLGAEGCWIQDPQRSRHVPVFKVQVVDTRGAGDAWVAGFLAGLLEGRDLEEAGRLGNALGAMCVTALGTTSGLQRMADVPAFMGKAEVVGPQ
jgi:sugar/nucleoside kinase (ribokinase family)